MYVQDMYNRQSRTSLGDLILPPFALLQMGSAMTT